MQENNDLVNVDIENNVPSFESPEKDLRDIPIPMGLYSTSPSAKIQKMELKSIYET